MARPAQVASMPVALLDRDVRPYSDFLFYDVGITLDDDVWLDLSKLTEYHTPRAGHHLSRPMPFMRSRSKIGKPSSSFFGR